jgi:hypothetical protein
MLKIAEDKASMIYLVFDYSMSSTKVMTSDIAITPLWRYWFVINIKNRTK